MTLEILSDGNRNVYDLVWAPVPVDLDEPDGPTDVAAIRHRKRPGLRRRPG